MSAAHTVYASAVFCSRRWSSPSFRREPWPSAATTSSVSSSLSTPTCYYKCIAIAMGSCSRLTDLVLRDEPQRPRERRSPSNLVVPALARSPLSLWAGAPGVSIIPITLPPTLFHATVRVNHCDTSKSLFKPSINHACPCSRAAISFSVITGIHDSAVVGGSGRPHATLGDAHAEPGIAPPKLESLSASQY
ncbi:hypothetical protein MIND_00292700 [Mycena indigotica]|uniref:Uncharacterized protein n=1 Tax=Mycena indigotica TaxID=2126181 RepID=A0A8H6T9Q6_9AGAR|nr:uncharacterized protein MIND_00292700 [Mycena indigotica]KAF7312776.1 hypothetical protein MIND_00292700 [Mycena indigotica]